MTNYTRVPLIIDALVSVFKAALPALDADGAVFDGPPTVSLPNDYAIVGYNPAISAAGLARPGLPAVMGIQDISLMGNEWPTESFDVYCSVSSYSGDLDLPARRLVVLGYFNLVAAGIAADRSLGGLITKQKKATITRFEWYIEQGAAMDGCAVTVMFTVNCAVDPIT